MRYKFFNLILLIIFLSSCTFVPKVTRDPDDSRCKLVTRQLTLDLIVPNGSSSCNDHNCLVAAAVYTAATGVVSGSIVLAGNMVHWLEKAGKCDNSFLDQKITEHNTPLLKQNGELITKEDSDTD